LPKKIGEEEMGLEVCLLYFGVIAGFVDLTKLKLRNL